MSTRSVIARPTEGSEHSWEGRYHHSDGYPSGLGKTLWDALHGSFAGDIHGLLKLLIDDHPAGWSVINDRDLTKPAGFVNWGDYPKKANGETDYAAIEKLGPACYCHGARNEEAWELESSEKDPSDREWAYVINPLSESLAVYEADTRRWHFVGTFSLSGPEPDWKQLNQGVLSAVS